MAERRFEIAGLGIRLASDSEDLLGGLAERWRTYEQAAGGAIDIDVRASIDATLTPAATRTDENLRPTVAAAPEGYSVIRDDFRARIDARRAPWEIEVGLVPSAYLIENVVRIAVSFRLSVEGGLLLHASGAIRGGRGLVFPAPSGTGKTTLARLLGEPLLGDEMVAVLPVAGQLVSMSTPFGGEMSPVERKMAPLLAILFLEQGADHAVRPSARPELLQRLLRNTLGFPTSGEDRARFLAAAEGILSGAPHVGVLAFAKNPTVAGFLEHQAGLWTAP